MQPETLARPPEVIPTIALSPEKVGKALNLEVDEVRVQLRSIDGRRRLFDELKNDPQKLAAVVDADSLNVLEQDMDLAQQDLAAEQRFLEAQQNPEKKGLFRRAWDTITGFPRRHPIITVALLGVVLGVVASYMGWLPRIDFPGLWGRMQNWLGWGAGSAASEAATEGVALGTEVASDFVPETLRIRIFEHSYIYGDKIYSMEELPSLIENLPELPQDEVFRILPYGNSRVTAEAALRQALQEKGLGSHLLETLAGQDFIPTAP